ncbi:MAG TPA: MarR family winged helix-turn-helix transcriptional regulator [Gemmatimonadales bacterium]|nr:MarR family winged helix-turn-helix transcriptional regulator [Gemmatimonadales bacterium]
MTTRLGPPRPTEPALADQVFTGLAKMGIALRSQAWDTWGPQELTPTQGAILAVLARRGEAVRPGAIARELAVTAPTVSDSVKVLAAKGLLQVRRAADDSRARAITLTDRGRRAARQTRELPEAMAQAAAALNLDEQAALLKALMTMIRELQVTGKLPAARMCVTCRFFRPNAHPGKPMPHHCDFVDAAFGDRALRLDCPEHERAELAAMDQAWEEFREAPLSRGRADLTPEAASATSGRSPRGGRRATNR